MLTVLLPLLWLVGCGKCECEDQKPKGEGDCDPSNGAATQTANSGQNQAGQAGAGGQVEQNTATNTESRTETTVNTTETTIVNTETNTETSNTETTTSTGSLEVRENVLEAGVIGVHETEVVTIGQPAEVQQEVLYVASANACGGTATLSVSPGTA